MADDEQHHHDFSEASAGASATFPQQCSALRKNGFVVIKGRPCKIVDMSTSKTGKHGHAKVHLVGIDIFTAKKYEELCPSTHNMDVPNIVTKTKSLVLVEDGFLHLMDDEGDITQDIKMPDGPIGDQIRANTNADGEPIGEISVTVKTAMGEEHATDIKITSGE
ncbi:eukaryotic translation initiation factor 5A-2 [Xylariaceae sp. FL1651]|nr:eukaryotic translation initiation factor 5A-2 [Xylariaceae sp. FL1651]